MDSSGLEYAAATVLFDHNNEIIFHHWKESISRMMFIEGPEWVNYLE
jgi:hypothetical protein